MVMGPATEVLVEIPTDGRGLQVSPLHRARIQQKVESKLAKVAAEPEIDRHAEPHLLSAQYRLRQDSLHGSLQDVLLDEPPDLEIRRQGCRKLDHYVIEKRGPHFEGVRPARDI